MWGQRAGPAALGALQGDVAAKERRGAASQAGGPRGRSDLEARSWQVGKMRDGDTAMHEAIGHLGKDSQRSGRPSPKGKV